MDKTTLLIIIISAGVISLGLGLFVGYIIQKLKNRDKQTPEIYEDEPSSMDIE